jgi:hypothetical protein
MTVNQTGSREDFIGDGVTVTFPLSIRIINATDIDVYVAGTQVFVGYTINVNANGVGGSLVFDAAPANGDDIAVLRIMDYTQELDLPNQGEIDEQQLEAQLDKQVLLAQQLAEELGRTFRAHPSSTVELELPEPEPEALLRWSADGTALENASLDIITEGPQGDPGTPQWQGPWSAITDYAVGDAVYDAASTSSYVANTANTNDQPPSANWDLLATAGGITPAVAPSNGAALFYSSSLAAWNPLIPSTPNPYFAVKRRYLIQPLHLSSTSHAATPAIALLQGPNQATANDADGRWISYTTAAALNATASLYTQDLVIQFRYKPRMFGVFKTPAGMANQAVSVGMGANFPSGGTIPADTIFIHYDPAVHGTAFFRVVHNDGAGGGTSFTTTVAVTAGTVYHWCIDATDTTSVKVWINGVLAHTITTDLPTAATNLIGCCMNTKTNAAAAKTIYVGTTVIEA